MRVMLKEILVSTISSVNILDAGGTSSAIDMHKKEKSDLVTMGMNLPVLMELPV